MKDKIEVKSIIDQYEYWILAALLFIALSLHLYCTWGGLIWNSDSFHYWAASRSFASEGTFISHGGGTYTFWPPLFPIILSAFPEEIYHVFHSLCFVTAILYIHYFLKEITSKINALITLAIFVISVFPYLISSFLWTETIFLLLLFSGLYYFKKWISNRQKNHLLIIASILLCLMTLQRNAGVFVVFGISIFCFFIFLRERKWRFLLKMAFLHILIILPNMTWNFIQKSANPEEYNFKEHPFFIDIFANFKTLSIELTRVFVPISENSNELLITTLGLILLSLIFYQKTTRIQFTITAAYIFLFLTLPKFELSETGRFVTPIMPLIILQMVDLIKIFYRQIRVKKYKILLYLAFICFMIYNVSRTTKNTKQWHYRSIHNPKSAKIFF